MPDRRWWLDVIGFGVVLTICWIGANLGTHVLLGWATADFGTMAVYVPLAYGYGCWRERRRNQSVIVVWKAPDA